MGKAMRASAPPPLYPAGADGNLDDEQDIAKRKAPQAGCGIHAGTDHLPRIGAHDLTNRNDAEDQATRDREQKGNRIGTDIWIDGHVDGNVGNGLPGAEHMKDYDAACKSEDAAGKGDECGLG